MSTETEYTIPKGTPSARKIQKFGSSETLEDTQENATPSDTVEPLVSSPKEQTPTTDPLPWELLDHTPPPTDTAPPETKPAENVNTTPPEPTPVAEEKVVEHFKKPILKILKSNGDSATNQSDGLSPTPRKPASIEIPQSVLTLLEENESDKKNLALFKTFMEDLPHICSGRITLSVQDDTICVWNYDEGVPFSFFCIMDGFLCCGVESSLVPKEESKRTWTPPTWLFPEPVSFFHVAETNPMIFNRIEQASLAATLTTTKMAL